MDIWILIHYVPSSSDGWLCLVTEYDPQWMIESGHIYQWKEKCENQLYPYNILCKAISNSEIYIYI